MFTRILKLEIYVRMFKPNSCGFYHLVQVTSYEKKNIILYMFHYTITWKTVLILNKY